MIVMESNGPLSQHISRTTKYWLSYITFDVYALNVHNFITHHHDKGVI